MIDELNRLLVVQNMEPVTGLTAERFKRFGKLLIEKNKVLNLTAIEDKKEIARRHFADSLMLFKDWRQDGRMIDIGCGGGFPGLPVAIYGEMLGLKLDVTLLDATGKKIAFVNEVIEALSLKNARGIAGRAEEEIDRLGRESFDLATARAVADMRVIAELALPVLKVGGLFYAWKTEKASEEVAAAESAVRTLGGRYAARLNYDGFYLQKCVKEQKTDPKYPRKYAQILKKKI